MNRCRWRRLAFTAVLAISCLLIGSTLLCYPESQVFNSEQSLPIIYVITATHKRPQQRSELTRLCNTLARVPRLHWIVVEDSERITELVTETLNDCGIAHTHLFAVTPPAEKPKFDEPFWWRPKGVHQRNRAIKWLRQDPNRDGVMYIADDDNTYDVRLFKEMRWTKRVAVWPVGFAGGLPYEGMRCSNGRVLNWIVSFKPYRPFPIDMAGFAINLRLLHKRPGAGLSYRVERGFQESVLLTSLGIKMTDLEAKADNCQRILVWHTRTAEPHMREAARLAARGITLPPVIGFI